MYQKSPFPYLVVFLVIVGLSCFTNLTIDKEIEQPIIHVIDQTSTNIDLESKDLKFADNLTQIAYNQ